MTERATRWLAWADRAWCSGALALLLTGAFVLVRLLLVGHGHPGAFVVLGQRHALGPHPGVRPVPGEGYDGQYYFRMALAPSDLRLRAHGVGLDTGLRRGRIGYPAVAYVLAAGQAAFVPWTLVLVNVLAVAAAAWSAGSLALGHGRHALWGLLVAGYPGLLLSVARDLTEPLTTALVVGALLALQRRRPWVAAALLSGAALTRETALLVPAALGAASLLRTVRGRRPTARDVAPWCGPLLVWVAWEGVCRAVYGALPAAGQGENAAPPFVAAARAVGRWVTEPTLDRLLFLAGVAGLVVVVAAALATAARTAPPYLVLSLVLAAGLVASLSANVWNDDPVELRTFVDVHVLGTTALLSAHRRTGLVLATVVTVPLWLVTAVLKARFL